MLRLEEKINFGRISNPTVHIVLGELRKVVNAIIKEYGRPTEVHLELVRDLKMNAEDKKNYISEQKKNKKANDERKEKIISLGLTPNRHNVEKLKLFDEIKEHSLCVYTGKKISCEKLFSEQIEIDHIIPKSCLDDSLHNKVLCYASSNRYKGDRTPYEAFKSSNDYNYDKILQRAECLPKNKCWRFTEDAWKKYDSQDNWLPRLLNDTAYASKITAKYLESVCHPKNIRVFPGRLTGEARYHWGLNNVLSKDNTKNREDNRHHAIDACVIALLDISLLQKIIKANKTNTLQKLKFPAPLEAKKQIEDILGKVVVSYRPDHSINKQLNEDTNYGLLGKEHSAYKEYKEKKDPLWGDGGWRFIQRKSVDDFKKKSRVKEEEKKERKENLTIACENLKKLFSRKKRFSKRSKKKLKHISKNRTSEYYFYPNGEHKHKIKWRDDFIGIQHADNQKYIHSRMVFPKGIHRLTVWKMPKKMKCECKSESYLFKGISYYEAKKNEYDQNNLKPHPAAKLIMTLHKGDIIIIDEGKPELYRVTSIRPGNQNIEICPVNKLKGKKTNTKLKYKYFSQFKNLKLRLVYVSILGKVIDNGPIL